MGDVKDDTGELRIALHVGNDEIMRLARYYAISCCLTYELRP